ncbi:MAG: hypothetical protein WCA04_12005 [Geobacteraceae bacterium]
MSPATLSFSCDYGTVCVVIIASACFFLNENKDRAEMVQQVHDITPDVPWHQRTTLSKIVGCP